MIGKVYNIPPQPPVEADTHRVAAGAVKESRLRTLAESIADLSDALDTSPQDWAASA